MITTFGALANSIDSMAIAELRKLLLQAELCLTVSRQALTAEFELASLTAWIGVDLDTSESIALAVSSSLTTWGHEPRLRLDPPAGPSSCDPALIQLIARGLAAKDRLLAMTQEDARAMPSNQLQHLWRIARLAYLASDIVKAILDGHQPRQVTARFLSRFGALPLAWDDQRKVLGFASI